MSVKVFVSKTDEANYCVNAQRFFYHCSIHLFTCLALMVAATLIASCGTDLIQQTTITPPKESDDNLQVTEIIEREIRVLQGPTIMLQGGGRLVVVAGNGTSGYSGDDGPATEASLNAPYGLTWDAEGNLYIGQDFRISKVDAATGVITTVAGIGVPGYSGDGGPATEAQFGRVQELAFDPNGNLYFADFSNHTIRRIDTNGVIRTVVGTGQAGFSPDGTPAVEAKINKPYGVAFDSDGILYFSDGDNHRIRILDVDGSIKTVAGTEGRGESGDGGPAHLAVLQSPRGLAFDAQGTCI